jgi:hypothetical protein
VLGDDGLRWRGRLQRLCRARGVRVVRDDEHLSGGDCQRADRGKLRGLELDSRGLLRRAVALHRDGLRGMHGDLSVRVVRAEQHLSGGDGGGADHGVVRDVGVDVGDVQHGRSVRGGDELRRLRGTGGVRVVRDDLVVPHRNRDRADDGDVRELGLPAE